tara:strand:- start:16 stop:495 length:480 start_codon:yes stop_codon:yes gene_type:complete
MIQVKKRIARICYHIARERLKEKHKFKDTDFPSFEDFLKEVKVTRDKVYIDPWKLPAQAESHKNSYRPRMSSILTQKGDPRCMARVHNGWKGGQCSFKVKDDKTKLCGNHYNTLKKHGHLVFNRIDEPRAINLPNKDKQNKRWKNTMEDEEKIIFSLSQ